MTKCLPSSQQFLFLLSISWFSTSSPAVTWDELRTSASTNILSIRSAEQSISKADAATSEAKGGYLPTVKGSASLNRTIDPEPAGAVTNNRLGLTASQNIFAGFSDQKNIEKAEAAHKSAIAARAAESVTQRSILRKLFNSGLYLQSSLGLTKKIVARREQNVRIVNLRYSSGLENKSSFLKTQASQLEAEADQDLIVANLALTKMEASRRTGRTISASENFDGQLPVSASSNALSGLHPDVAQAQSERDSAAASVEVSRAGWYPQLTADASAYRNGTDIKLEPQNRYEVGLTLTVPLYTPAQSPRYRESVADLSKAEIGLASAQLESDLRQKKAIISVADAKRRVEVSSKSLEASRMQAEVYRNRYTLGLISFQDWDAAESDYIKADKDFLVAEQSLANAIAEQDAALGRKLEDEGP